MPDRARNIAEIEVRFREINERMRESLTGVVTGDDVLDFVCECGHAECTAAVGLTLPEYEGVRGNARRFAILAGHELPDVETVVARTERYTVIEKIGSSVPVTERHDPRS